MACEPKKMIVSKKAAIRHKNSEGRARKIITGLRKQWTPLKKVVPPAGNVLISNNNNNKVALCSRNYGYVAVDDGGHSSLFWLGCLGTFLPSRGASAGLTVYDTSVDAVEFTIMDAPW